MKAGSFCSSLIPLIIFCCCSTTQPAPHLDNVHVVFGEVVSGQEVVTHIEGLPVDRMSRPLQDAKVVNCGELILKIKNKVKKREAKQSSSSDSESDSYVDKVKKKKKNKKSKKRTKLEDGETRDSNEEDNGQPHPLVSITKIDPDEIPEVPANKFLYRAGPTNNANQKEFRQHYGRDRIRSHRKTGRIFKGRGIFRYHTPSRSRSRSVTPPHWKQAQNRTIKLHEFQKIEKERMKKEEELKQREADRIKRFGENPDEDNQVSDNPDNNICPAEFMEDKENDQMDKATAVNKITQQQSDIAKRSAEGNNVVVQNKEEVKYNKNEKSVRRDGNRSYSDRSSRRDSRDRNRRRRRSRSKDRRRSRERDYDRRGSRDRRNRRNYSPRRRDSHRVTKTGGRDYYKHYDKRNDHRRSNNSNSYQDNDFSSRYDKSKHKRNDNNVQTDTTTQPKFKRRSRSSSSNSQHSKD
ncbi:PREDICTED: peptidyl-prolyl cis-trans isomerase G isoform X2 [Dinoponera quadriceps]|uniref:Peptidyl-prolyl cis-trans isomerase G isoform X2 n=1 Tax=Dinoponera quadriceps TaxID=609295 RepID=A0A6P3WW25_DINQU|nr:PREDICTED: peptidyl-prolyl cis-trans isomerase G isoform X2 [Dinoponera quadriceps]